MYIYFKNRLSTISSMNQIVSYIHCVKIGIQNMHFPLTFTFQQFFFNIKEENAKKRACGKKDSFFAFLNLIQKNVFL